MSKYSKPADQYAVAGKSVGVELTRVIAGPLETTPAVLPAHPGKVNYLGKTKPSKVKPANIASVRRVERKVITQGQYFGSAERVFAFVMLDEETAPAGDAANDPKMN